MNAKALSAHVLQAFARAQSEGRRTDLDTLTAELGVRRADVRTAISALHREGLVDALRMRASLAGFAIGRSLMGQPLPALRRVSAPAIVAA